MNPLLFCVNVHPNIFTAFRLAQFQTLINHLRKSSKRPVEVIPNMNSGPISKRGNYFEKQISRVMANLKAKECHLLGYSFSGVDLRCALNSLETIKPLSLTTIATPHKQGSYLIDEHVGQRISNLYMDPISRITGLTRHYMEEVNTENMREFNLQYINRKEVKYFSINGESNQTNINDLLVHTANIIEQSQDIPQRSDGLFKHSETEWGEQLLTIEADHYSILGCSNAKIADVLAKLIHQNLNDVEGQKSA